MSTSSLPVHITPPLKYSGFDDASTTEVSNPMEVSLYNRSTILQKLAKLKNDFSNDPKVEAQFANRRKMYAEGTISKSVQFRNQFETALNDINGQAGGSALTNVRGFLDLGCAPGGFPNWVLKKNPEARGVGVTLSMEERGWEMVLDPVWAEGDHKRFDFLEADVSDRTAWPIIEEKLSEIGGGCDLIIAGAVFREQEGQMEAHSTITSVEPSSKSANSSSA